MNERSSAPPPTIVLVTGAVGGIGQALLAELRLAGLGAIGGVRRADQLDAVAAHGARPLLLDVTDAASLAVARATVELALAGERLMALVNLAGVSTLGPVSHLPIGELRRVLEVNVVGLAAVCQTFLPLMADHRGRIVNLSSMSAAVPLPFLGAYAASKAAVDALSDSLRQELMPRGVAVTVLAPGPVRGGLAGKLGVPERWAGLPAALPRGIRHVHAALLASQENGLDPVIVARRIVAALLDPRPPATIRMPHGGWRSRLQPWLPDLWRAQRTARWVWRDDSPDRPGP